MRQTPSTFLGGKPVRPGLHFSNASSGMEALSDPPKLSAILQSSLLSLPRCQGKEILILWQVMEITLQI